MNSVDDFISQKEKKDKEFEKSIREEKRWVKFYQNIDAYSEIGSGYTGLIKSFGSHIKNFDFNTNMSQEFKNGTYILAQIKTKDNKTMAAMIERKEAIFLDYRSESNPPKKIGPIADIFRDFLPASYFSNPTPTISEDEYNRYLIEHNGNCGMFFRKTTDKNISEEEYKRRLGQFQLIGSQNFFALSLKKFSYDYLGSGFELDRIYYAFFSEDGQVFIDKTLATDLKYHTDYYALGNYLAEEAQKQKVYTK